MGSRNEPLASPSRVGVIKGKGRVGGVAAADVTLPFFSFRQTNPREVALAKDSGSWLLVVT
jgi:hypothetical protein